MTTHISFVRHGLVDNPQGVFYGRLPGFGLSAEGRRQARAAAEALRLQPIAAIYTSPQLRAHETAAAIQATHPHLPVQETPLLSEIHTPFDGQPRHVLEARHWDTYTGTTQEYEQPVDIRDRAQAFIAQVRARHVGQRVVAVTHGDVVSFLILWVNGRPVTPQYKDALADLKIPGGYPAPASITTLFYRTDDPDETPEMAHAVPYAD